MKKTSGVLLLAAVSLLLSGCSMRFSAEEDAVYVNKDGEIIGAIVEPFDKDYYDADELETLLEQEVAEYNGENGRNSIEVDSFRASGNEVKVMMNYATWADYAHFNDVEFFAGVLSDIQGKNYGTGVTFLDTSGNEAPGLDEMDGNYRVILLEEQIVVQTSGKIVYVSDNVAIEGEKLARVLGDDEEEANDAQSSQDSQDAEAEGEETAEEEAASGDLGETAAAGTVNRLAYIVYQE